MSLPLIWISIGRRQPLIDYRIYKSACLKVSGQLGHVIRQLSANPLHVLVASYLVPLLQAHLHKRGIHRRIAGIKVEKMGVIPML